MTAIRTLIALAAAAALVSVLAMVALAAPATGTHTAAAAQYCPPGDLQARKDAVAAFTAQVKARNDARKAYFKSHRLAKQRVAYDKATQQVVVKLAKARQQLNDCH